MQEYLIITYSMKGIVLTFAKKKNRRRAARMTLKECPNETYSSLKQAVEEWQEWEEE